jgi:hypothetical protein
MWNQRTDFHIFNMDTGEGKYVSGNASMSFIEDWMKENRYFNKVLGTGTITEVFKVQMEKGFDELWMCRPINQTYFLGFENSLAKRDGFKNPEMMFKWFDEHYDLSTPKDFWVYRWEWD